MTEHARRLWTVTEPIHALTYFAPESHSAFEDAGLRGFWRGYFAGRAAPMGAVSAGTVTATFFGFHPDFVARAIPAVWSTVEPADAIAARLDGAARAIDRIVGSDATRPEVLAAVDALRAAIDDTPVAGRPLFGGNAALDWPDTSAAALWHATTLLREQRGDGHVNVLATMGVDPCEAHVLRIADDGAPLESIQPYRGWSDGDWAAAAQRLHGRGWIDDRGEPTGEGRLVRRSIEHGTDRLNAELVDRIAAVEGVIAALRPVADRIRESGVVPYPNPIGLPEPS